MIIVNLAQKQEEAIQFLEAYNGGDFSFKFEGKQGIRLKFSVTGDANEAAVKAKALIKGQSWAASLFFNVTVG